jgi:hypothetical protein
MEMISFRDGLELKPPGVSIPHGPIYEIQLKEPLPIPEGQHPARFGHLYKQQRIQIIDDPFIFPKEVAQNIETITRTTGVYMQDPEEGLPLWTITFRTGEQITYIDNRPRQTASLFLSAPDDQGYQRIEHEKAPYDLARNEQIRVTHVKSSSSGQLSFFDTNGDAVPFEELTIGGNLPTD